MKCLGLPMKTAHISVRAPERTVVAQVEAVEKKLWPGQPQGWDTVG